VNLSHDIHPGWGKLFPSYMVYMVLILAGCTVCFLVFQMIINFTVRKIKKKAFVGV
jgi:hypothetical protein